MDVDEFIRNWAAAPISERAHYQTFISQLCRLIGAPAPDERTTGDLDYGFERPVRFHHEDGGSHSGFIDCYRRGCFVLEAKQSRKRVAGGELDPAAQLAALAGVKGRRPGRRSDPVPSRDALDRLMRTAKRQAEGYARALDEWPPFLIVVDVGRSIELWADFARQGKSYVPFPDRARHRIDITDLKDPDTRAMLAQVWTDPLGLDPSARVAEVTTDIARRLALLVRSIRARAPAGPDGAADDAARSAWAGRTALFVMQCIFAMFADSVNLIADRGFLSFLESYRGKADQFHKGAGEFFRQMDRGGHCAAIQQDLRRFNGGLFRHVSAMPITEPELEALITVARRDWASVEPAIFGTLLEQALDPSERAELGAHYTPSAYVRRLVEPTVMEPLRGDWQAAEAQAIALYATGREREARAMIRAFHHVLCRVRVLDPACGAGNFLYVAMRMMKELEAEVLATLADMGDGRLGLGREGETVSPGQFLGIEKNAQAAGIAELVMWIGHLQWRFHATGQAQASDPVLRDLRAIQTRDALIERRGGAGAPRPADWPEAEFIIGNPPFIGGKDLRAELGDDYVDDLWAIRQGRFRSADLVTAWWERAADILVRPQSVLRRFGFITTNSITQTFSRRVLEHHLSGRPPLRLTFAIPDHPWIKGRDAAAVRIAMTVAERGRPEGKGRLLSVTHESGLHTDTPVIAFQERQGDIAPDLTVGPDVTGAVALKANAALCAPGVKLHGAGFIVTPERAAALEAASDPDLPSPIRPYSNGRDLADRPRGVKVIDLFGWSEAEVRRRHPAIYQHLLETVKPERDANRRAAYRDNWWIFGEPRRDLRPALAGLSRYIATVETAKHRWFRFLDADVTPDNKLIVVASEDPAVLGVLSSRAHQLWHRANAGRIGVYDGDAVYVKGACFDRFPFPVMTAGLEAEIGALAQELDDLRRRVLDRHPALTMTGLYNARARIGRPDLTEAERAAHEAGCVGLIDHLHRRLDAAVAAAYGWPAEAGDQAGDEAVLGRLVALNRERAEEEAAGRVRFLRPAYQAGRVRAAGQPIQTEAPLAGPDGLPPLPDQPGPLALALLGELHAANGPVEPRALVGRFDVRPGRRAEARIEQTLAVLAVAGSVRRVGSGWFMPRRAL